MVLNFRGAVRPMRTTAHRPNSSTRTMPPAGFWLQIAALCCEHLPRPKSGSRECAASPTPCDRNVATVIHAMQYRLSPSRPLLACAPHLMPSVAANQSSRPRGVDVAPSPSLGSDSWRTCAAHFPVSAGIQHCCMQTAGPSKSKPYVGPRVPLAYVPSKGHGAS